MSVNSGLKANQIIGERKAFYWQRIPEFSRARKETVDIEILVTSRNGDRKIMQFIRLMSRQALAYEKQGRATIACLVTKFRGYRRVKSYRPLPPPPPPK